MTLNPPARHGAEAKTMEELSFDDLLERVWRALPEGSPGLRESELIQRLAHPEDTTGRIPRALWQLQRECRAFGAGGWWRKSRA